ncbi:DUF4259 domain-containing protein [Rheinheimera baltica]|uniref:DUF4259 domain-containing protein n=1 Tax=Rheinheimera baltica TaxID=67576 RepID=A0ABT9I5N5_9GAMM|nr:DUF4259 domain-containing protein [Rheinheimera baltica]MDP5138256.1 DUF4259 domain-containing protein [Rheinheimera baltica]MDP5148607.1 DUF4259 domain-containing protein [Rheinheimera baltica]
MGAWSAEPFGNDTACDWASELEESKGLSAVNNALQAVLACDDYIDTDIGEEALAAVEVIAKLLGKGTQNDAYTEDVDAWVAAQTEQPDASVIANAKQVIKRLSSDESELMELWEDDADFTDTLNLLAQQIS